MIVPFGPWLPDQPRYNNPCITATNVYPTLNGYKRFLGPSSAATDALAASPVGALSFRRSNGVRETFVGTETALYRKNGETWTSVGTGYSNSTYWRFQVYGSRVVATNGIDNPQKFDLATDSSFSTLTNAPICERFIVIRDVLVALNTANNDIQFSAVNDSEDWTVLGGGGNQDLFDGGPVISGVGGEYGIIFQEFATVRMDFVGGDLRFTFDKIEGAIGAADSESVVPYKGGAFYLSSEGFQFFDGAQSQNISDEKVTRTFISAIANARGTSGGDTRVTSSGDIRVVRNAGADAIIGAHDPDNSVVAWSYNGATGRRIILYNYKLGRWAESDVDVAYLHTSYQAGGVVLAGFNSLDELVFFDTDDLTSTISTGDMDLANGQSVFVSSVRGIVDAAHDVTVGKKSFVGSTESTVSASSQATGRCALRSYGRLHRFELTPTAQFTEAVGVDVETRQGGSRY